MTGDSGSAQQEPGMPSMPTAPSLRQKLHDEEDGLLQAIFLQE